MFVPELQEFFLKRKHIRHIDRATRYGAQEMSVAHSGGSRSEVTECWGED